ncbi:MAG: tRNA preQ1(34) S-adenosylmethionine ribosyltransferase-isomerase QueA [Spirochaetia bacterium]|nr:tRNA preQ1(34) S-adenosylmethionine ribosyltransferase-isomerase QueA [Spirochaetia bacterium]MDD6930058.1 tRNA preQ1(34) S-adenosylmethionine ribosyltransferase-isomerase QueA [Treponema sp.]MCI5608433.1 tRNA preQ1(34) S-adenosylmethionine ribosyltransferase-isomerase QueA [Spirochaetia bacterium]MCI6827585.1 tRNA preQ1(34) S-adenosylmethionine ribosyltransferase-isomerase QueA [Spirochaetia bacterium]MCI7109534.1 tRNA preQ1(34) S-adenosylmethionine ribosyltransferase-isomerase QueA [Spiroc
MKLTDFDFDLPQDLIAQKPSGKRGDDRLMLLDRKNGSVFHHQMNDLPDLIMPGTLMIFNNSKVRRARCYGIKETTGRNQEFMFLNQLDKEGFLWNTMVKSAKKQKNGMRYQFPDGTVAQIVDFPGNEKTEFRALKFDFPLDEKWFEKNGHIPLPPYIKREDTEEDSERYQNVYAKETGSAACPTAGLHFTEEMLSCLAEKNIERDFVTLHVGLGTFLPVRESIIENHKMHEEVYTISESTAEKINKAKREGRPILAVGTTSVRTLESSADEKGFVKSGTSSTRIFMYPGYKFKVVDQMFTNFHTPESTLIMLVSAFAGRENILNAYKNAVENRYRFFSYGDAMFIR